MAEEEKMGIQSSAGNKKDMDILLFLLVDELSDSGKCAQRRRRQTKTSKVHPMFTNRSSEGAYQILVNNYLKDNDTKFAEYFRLTPALFHYILEQVQPYNRNKRPITAEEKPSITLRYLATGESFRSLAFQFRVHNSWVSGIVRKCLESIRNKFFSKEIPEPTQVQFKKIAEDYFTRWHYPLCCGALDGKHIRIECPKGSGSLYFNYKEYFSVVLLALVDAQYKFIAVDIGSYGREGDAGIFLKSNLGKRILAEQYNIPPPVSIPETTLMQEHVTVADEVFALHKNLMKPYCRKLSQQDKKYAVYNYRHSRARRTSENMSSYFRVFFTPIKVKPDTVDLIVTAACILHNMMRHSKIKAPNQVHFNNVDISVPTENLIDLAPANHGHNNQRAVAVRDRFCEYFNGMGAVSWQNQQLGLE